MLTTTSETTIYPIYDTVAGGNSKVAGPGVGYGKYLGIAPPRDAFDQNGFSGYIAYGQCNGGQSMNKCGNQTGVYLTPSRGASTLVAIQFQTAPIGYGSDPLTITIEGSNQTAAALTSGSSWSTIYTGPTGLTGLYPNPGRSSYGTIQYLPSNPGTYTSYRVLVTSIRSSSKDVNYAEIRLLGY